MKTAFPQVMGTCKITLYSNIPFDNNYNNHTMISRVFNDDGDRIYNALDTTYGQPCERFINRRLSGSPSTYYYPRYELTGDFNFNFSNGLIASVTLELTPAQTNANYLKLVCGEDIYYYFVTGIKQDNFDTYTLSLELDVLMTYQDEFLLGMSNVPVFTTRKHSHRYTNNGLYPHCADFKHNESTFANIKPSLVKEIHSLNLPLSEGIRNIKWLYICCDDDYVYEQTSTPPSATDYDAWNFFRYKYKNVKMPLMMICVPLNITSITFTNGNDTCKIEGSVIETLLHNLVGSGKVHGAKISQYPPFIINTGDTISFVDNELTITSQDIERVDTPLYNTFIYHNVKGDLVAKVGMHFIAITKEEDEDYVYDTFTLNFHNAYAPSVTSLRYEEPKLLFNPFKKYVLTASYSQGNEMYPELIYSDGVYESEVFKFSSIYNFFIGDYSLLTYQNELTDANNIKFYQHYKINNIGLSSSVNHTIPVGTDALDVFNATQANSFYTSKVASGITSGLTIAGGIGSIVLGTGMTAGSSGALTPMGAGLVAGGVSAIAGGVTGVATTIKSTNAKIEDLKNTPDAINTQGSSFVGDLSKGSVMPKVIVYDVSQSIKKQANDFFYNYGYEVGRECYFNTDLYYDNDESNTTDNNLFGRTLFNYIKLNEDITNKINRDIPLIVKKKISTIFNNGITIWSFFGFKELWRDQLIPTTSDYQLDKFFLKCEYDNTEWHDTLY